MLSQLQRRVAMVLAGLPEAEGFALAGGGALIARGMSSRATRDLDFFVGDGDSVDRLLPALESALAAEGFSVERRQVAHGFARLAVTAADDHTEVDLCVDYRMLPAERTSVGPTLALEELAVNKLLALFGRAEARDFVDFAVLEPSFGLDHLCRRASDKDPGFDQRGWARCCEASIASRSTSSSWTTASWRHFAGRSPGGVVSWLAVRLIAAAVSAFGRSARSL